MVTDRRPFGGHLRNVAPAAFVQMIAIERETCALGVRADGRQGTLFFVGGDLCHGVLDGLRGEEAAILILGWDRADVETQAISEPPPRSINAPLTFILLEAMRRRDEDPATSQEPAPPRRSALLQELVQGLDGLTGACLVDLASGQPLAAHFLEGSAIDAAGVSHASRAMVDAELAVLAAAGAGSALEEILLSFDELLIIVRLVRRGTLLAVVADRERTGIPAVYAALHRLGPALAEEASTWHD